MKKNIKYLFGLPILMLFSCNNYLDLDNFQNIPTEDAYNTVQDVQNGMNGAYFALGHYYFYGRNVVAIGDMASDNGVASLSYGHFVAIYQYSFSDTESSLDQVWTGGYRVLDRATRTIQGAEKVLAEAEALHLTDNDIANLHSFISQCYALKALSAHSLVNIFGLPYRNTQSNDQPGIVVIKKEPIPPFTNVARSTVEESYAQILSDIASAKMYYVPVDNYNADNEDDQILLNQYYMNKAAIYALEARVALFMQDYDKALNAADSAIFLRNATPITDEAYLKMWSSTAISEEDILTIAKSDNDNLSANSLNTLYGSYEGRMTQDLYDQFDSLDIRLRLLNKELHPKKFDGTPTAQSVNNIPVFRVSEMYLIKAEVYAQKNETGNAQTALLYTAKRNKAITGVSSLPSDKEGLLQFIAQERRREFFEEGFRWYDARRTGEHIMASDGAYENFNVAGFVYPIPASEINAGFGVIQNPDWPAGLPE